MVLSIKRNSSILITQGDLGSLPPSVNIIINCLSYFIRVQEMPTNSLLYKAFLESKRLQTLGFDTWYGGVCKLANNNNIDLDQPISKINIKTIVINTFKANWKKEINNLIKHPSLRTYIHIKSEFKLEPFSIFAHMLFFSYKAAILRY